jgi:ATP synthase protein I
MTFDPSRSGLNHADRLMRAARRAVERAELGRETPEPSLGARLGQIGVLGWAIVAPTLLGLFIGRWLDRTYMTQANGPSVFFSATFLMLGAAIGFWSAWRWMHGRNV